VKIDISPGELFDRLTIIEIKLERIAAPEKQLHLRREYETLCRLRDTIAEEKLAALVAELKELNAQLWQIEDGIREHERRQDFGPSFVALARAIYRQNDRRAAVKRAINERCGSTLMEEKSYTAY
jgi:3-methyladenine DNA glycosylase/8-oxoguanine DNA glycosylase